MSGGARRLTAAQAPDAARALALAFQDDPVLSWALPRPDRRRRIIGRGFFLFANRIWLPDGEAYGPDGDVAGAACWLPPGRWHLPARRQLELLPSILRIAGLSAPRFLWLQSYVERHHPDERDHWYLAALGVRPDSQGRGLGSKLMHPILSRCDEQGVPAYLEASSEGSRALYERHGFEVTGELRLPRGGPPLWPMWREPAPSHLRVA